MMNIFKNRPNNIFLNILPIYYFSKVFGYAYFTLTCKDNEYKNATIPTSRYDYFRMFIFFIIQASILFVNVTFDQNIHHTTSVIMELGSRVVLSCGVLNAMVSKICIFFAKGQIWTIVTKLHEVDLEVYIKLSCCINVIKIGYLYLKLLNLDYEINHKKQNKLLFGLIFVLILVFLLNYSVTCFLLSQVFDGAFANFTYLGYYFVNLSYATMFGQFLILLLTVYSRFLAINECFKYKNILISLINLIFF